MEEHGKVYDDVPNSAVDLQVKDRVSEDYIYEMFK